MNRVCIETVEDRSVVAAVLIKNGYTVRSGSQRREGSKSYDYFLECWTGTSKDVVGKLYIDSEDDQLAVATILVKNKYTVRSFSQVRKGVREYFFLEFEPNAQTKKGAEKGES